MLRSLALLTLALAIGAPIRAVYSQNENDRGRTWVAALSEPTENGVDTITIRTKRNGKTSSTVLPINIDGTWDAKQKCQCVGATLSGAKGADPGQVPTDWRIEVVGEAVAVVGQKPAEVTGIAMTNNSSQRSISFVSFGRGGGGGGAPASFLIGKIQFKGKTSGEGEITYGVGGYEVTWAPPEGTTAEDVMKQAVRDFTWHGIDASIANEGDGDFVLIDLSLRDRGRIYFGSTDVALKSSGELTERD